MTHGSLFSGIGGFDLAAEWMGWDNIFHCEINPFCQKVLKHHFPNAESLTDITKTDFKKYNGTIDIISGGFPCQPYSLAGKRKGKEDERHLWPEMLRAIREIQPRWVVGENVFGLVNWSGGLVFHEVQTNLEAEGYEVWSYVLPAVAKDAVHRRDRIWIVANCNKQYGGGIAGINEGKSREERLQERNEIQRTFKPDSLYASNIERIRQQGSGQSRRWGNFEAKRKGQTNFFEPNNKLKESWLEAATRLCSMDDELAGRLDTATISKIKWRTESLKAYGNAIYWPVAFEIFKAIEQTELNFFAV